MAKKQEKPRIFLCYRGGPGHSGESEAGHFKTVAVESKRRLGKIWYSPDEPEGNFDTYDAIMGLLSRVEYFIIFIEKNFTDDFIRMDDGDLKPVAAKEIACVLKTIKEKKREVHLIGINLRGEKLDLDKMKSTLIGWQGLTEEDVEYLNDLNVNTRASGISGGIFYQNIVSHIPVVGRRTSEKYTPEQFNEVYAKGKLEGDQEGFKRGQAEGYKEGFEAGHVAGLQKRSALEYEKGYKQGYALGLQEGGTILREARAIDREEGYKRGYEEGHRAGLQEMGSQEEKARETERMRGTTEGYNRGYNEGREKGYREGWNDAKRHSKVGFDVQRGNAKTPHSIGADIAQGICFIKAQDKISGEDIHIKDFDRIVWGDNLIKEIGQAAFAGCENLVFSTESYTENALFIPQTVCSIKRRAFANCKGLRKVYIPIGVGYMEEDVFMGCSEDLQIYCEAKQRPVGWDIDWARTLHFTQVHWGAKIDSKFHIS